MSPLEIWCNESQERYVIAVMPEDLARFEAICERERCPYSVVGEALAEEEIQVEDPHPEVLCNQKLDSWLYFDDGIYELTQQYLPE